MTTRNGRIEERARFDLVRYANCWEDAAVLVRALDPAPGRRILSIASAGDNSFSLLARGADVVAADLSPAQLALVELKAAAIRHLERPACLAFLGIEPADDRRAIYGRLEPELSDTARAFWRTRQEDVAGGVVHAGRFEAYFRLFRTRVLPWIHRRRTVEALLEPRSLEARRAFYAERWDTWRWRLVFRLFFSRFAMGRLGRDPEFFRYVEGSVAERILERARFALTELPATDNPYLEYILRGTFRAALPPYLEPAAYEALRRRMREAPEGLTLHLGPVEEAARRHAGDGFDGFNLSDVFEYLDAGTCTRLYAALLEHARPGARLAYWNMLVPRRRPDAVAARVRSLEGEARNLFLCDRAFFYSAFVLEQVEPGGRR